MDEKRPVERRPELENQAGEKKTYEKPSMEEQKPLDKACAQVYYTNILPGL